MNVLIKFRHGLGDAVQLTSVLSHLKYSRPNWEIDVAALVGKHSAFHGLCRHAFILDKHRLDPSVYDHVYELDWPECPTCYANWPSTKAERCLIETFGVDPEPNKCRYTIRRGDRAMELARDYLENHCKVTAADDGRYPVVLVHYQGNTSGEAKDLPEQVVRRVCDEIIDCGAVPVILDWDKRSKIPDSQRVFAPPAELELWGGTGTGDAEGLVALIELSALMIGIDSGPLHVAAATSTPTIGVWTGHHPLHYIGHADNVTHLVPKSVDRLLRGSRAAGSSYFKKHYRYEIYENLEDTLVSVVRGRLRDTDGGMVFTRNFWIRPNNADQDLCIVRDIAENDSYQIDELPMPRPVVFDVGAHIGVFSKRLYQRNPLARIFAVECCPENLLALEKNVGHFATVIQGAVTYEKDVSLLNAVYPGCVSTGGSTVVAREDLERRVEGGQLATMPGQTGSEYWADFRKIRTLTLEEILEDHGLDRIDILKLDCEGSEFSILENTSLLDRIGLILGEYHGKNEFLKLVEERFAGWKLRILIDGELGNFWLTRRPHETKP